MRLCVVQDLSGHYCGSHRHPFYTLLSRKEVAGLEFLKRSVCTPGKDQCRVNKRRTSMRSKQSWRCQKTDEASDLWYAPSHRPRCKCFQFMPSTMAWPIMSNCLRRERCHATVCQLAIRHVASHRIAHSQPPQSGCGSWSLRLLL